MAQTYITPSSGSTTITTCSGTLYDPGGTDDYPYNCDGTITIYPSIPGCKIHLEGDYSVSAPPYSYDYLYVNGTRYNEYDHLSVTSTYGPITIRFTSDNYRNASGYEFTISCVCDDFPCVGPPCGISATPGFQSMELSWTESEGVSQYFIEYGFAGFALGTGTIITSNTNTCTINNLIEGTYYDFYVYYDCGNDGAITNEVPGSISAQVPNGEVFSIPSSGSHSHSTCLATILDPGGYDYSYPDNCNEYIVIESDSLGCVVDISGNFNLAYTEGDYLIIYDGIGTSGTELFNSNNALNGNGYLHAVSSIGPLTLYFYSSSTPNHAQGYSGFEVQVHCIGGCGCGGSPSGVHARQTYEGMRISWNPSLDTTMQGYIIEYGPEGFTPGTGTLIYTTDTSYEFTNLTALNSYDFYVYFDCGNDGILTDEISTQISFCVPEANSCLDLSDLNQSNITCISNHMYNYNAVGIIDYGENDIRSIHTVHHTQAYDSRACGLSVIPPCENYSVRLGNWDPSDDGESISIDYNVDTTIADILVLKYAAVLEDPEHFWMHQPGFSLSLPCGSADFISGPSLRESWNTCGSSRLWKDWTSVGFDVSSYHRQNINITLSTRDCSFGEHYGYAYFHLGCRKKKIVLETCGETLSATYTAPEGFTYQWYYRSNPNNILSTDQTATIDLESGEDTLCCWCSNIEFPNCGFELTTVIRSHYPLAHFSAERDSCSYTYTFLNGSAISNDGVTPNGSGEHCDGAYWDFGDGTTSTEMNPHHDFQQPGIYSVQLIATLNHDACQDTIIQIIEIPDNTPIITGSSDICRGESATLTATGGIGYEWSANGEILGTDATITVVPDATTTYTLHSADTNGCSMNVEHTIAVHDTVAQYFQGVICQGERYGEYGFSVAGTTAPTVIQEAQHLQTQYGCDSIVYLSLTVNPLPNVMLGPDMVHCFERDGAVELSVPEIDCESYLWNTGETSQTVYAPAEGTYSVIAVKNGCENSDEITISDVCEFQIYLPNCITPSTDDGMNDYFCLPSTKDIKEFEVTIFDRWGKIIYTSNDPNFRWDGTVNGKLCVDMVFAYRMEILTTSEEKHILKGTITVL